MAERAIPLSSEQDFLQIARIGGISGVLEVMRQDLDVAWVQKMGCDTIRTFSLNYFTLNQTNPDADESATNPLTVFLENEGMPLILHLMNRYVENQLVITSVCNLVAYITRFDSMMREVAGEMGVIESLISLLPVHITNPSVQQQTIAALHSLSIDLPNCFVIAEDRMGLSEILMSMTKWLNNKDIQLEVIPLLINLCRDKTILAKVVEKNNGRRLVLLALKEHINSVEVVSQAVSCLMGLTTSELHVFKLMEVDGVSLIVDAFANHSHDPIFVQVACETLKHFCTLSESVIVAIHRTKFISLLESSLQLTYNPIHIANTKLAAEDLLIYLNRNIIAGKYGLVARNDPQKRKDIIAHEARKLVASWIVYGLFLGSFVVWSILASTGEMNYRLASVVGSLVSEEEFDEDIYPHYGMTYDQISDVDQVWHWLEGPVIGAMNNNEWYNGDLFSEDYLDQSGTFVGSNKILGGVRLRQLRSQNGTCTVPESMKGPAYDSLRISSDNVKDYSLYPDSKYNQAGINYCYDQADGHFIDTASFGNSRRGWPVEYRYWSETETKGGMSEGHLQYYSGGGYVVGLPSDSTFLHTNPDGDLQIPGCGAECALGYLKEDLWLDQSTRALFVEFALYNAASAIFMGCQFLLEFPTTGGVITSATFRPATILRYQETKGIFVLGLEIVLLCFVTHYFIRTYIALRDRGFKAYYRAPFNVLTTINLLAWIGVIGLRLHSMYYQQLNLDIRSGVVEDQFVNLTYISNIQMYERTISAFNGIIMWLKVFEHLKISQNMSFLMRMLGRSSTDIVFFLGMMSLVFFGFCTAALLVFSSGIYEYRNFLEVTLTLFRSALSDMDYKEMYELYQYFGPFFHLLFQTFVFIIFMNVFIAILDDTFTETKNIASIDDMDPELRKIKEFLENNKLNVALSALGRKGVLEWGLDDADENKDGLIDRNEFKKALRKDPKMKDLGDSVLDALFDKFDKDNSGGLNAEEVKDISVFVSSLFCPPTEQVLPKRNWLTVPFTPFDVRRSIQRWNTTFGSNPDYFLDDDDRNSMRRVVRRKLENMISTYSGIAHRNVGQSVELSGFCGSVESLMVSLDEGQG
eukprot:TRINITY_DN5498_c0_g1_i1.p1 TRINITY_DN5498_c0_g1~~TRINITY_DN5498_c0_g1_i1.p1  ORF type:complete len:1091 (-),score=219.12 TRINITY_DN5498_c0_g1_i1:247-3519(-)